MIALLWASPARAVMGDICVSADVDYVDLAGDRWIDNGVDRPARFLRISVTDSSATTTHHWLDDEGCIDLNLPVGAFSVTVKSKADVNGVELEAFTGPSDGNRYLIAKTFDGTCAPGSGFSYDWVWTPTSYPAVWQALMAGVMVFKDTDWNIHQGPLRDCCEFGTEDDDGTCTNSADFYVPLTGPIQIQAWHYPGADGPSGPQSELVDTIGVNQETGVYTDATDRKFPIGHELGHIIVHYRAGGRERVKQDATHDGCMGSYVKDTTTGESEDGYAYLTKEYLSLVFKEGWADFVAMVTWNDPSTEGCDLQNSDRDHDWDLDLTPDFAQSYRTSNPTGYRTVQGVNVDTDDLVGTIECDDDPDLEGLNPAYSWGPVAIDGRNWLHDVESLNDASGCARLSSTVQEANRSTRYDVARMYWALRTTQDLTPEELSDLAVSTCFRSWRTNDATSLLDLRLPMNRLYLSADAVSQDVLDALIAEVDHVAH